MPDTPPASSSRLIDRALRRIADVWRDMASSVSREEDVSIDTLMRACLDGHGGEVSARNRAAKLAETYLSLDDKGRREFLLTAAQFDTDDGDLTRAIEQLAAASGPERAALKSALRRTLEPPRQRLLTQFTSIPDGMKFLVEMRSTLLTVAGSDPMLAALEADLRFLLANWFDYGFLELHRIDWNTPAALLEKLVGYEAVHEITSWRDLKNRLDSDRRCYAFFHPRMPDEPLIFVEVALVRGLANSVQRLLDEDAPVGDPHSADTAIFYSISNCQRGLSGISFGNFLIKRVVGELSAEFPKLKHFATLSPIPGFRRWLDKLLAEADPTLLLADEQTALAAIRPGEGAHDVLKSAIAKPGWRRDPLLVKTADPALIRLCARYLLDESRNGRALDPVAHFHLSNGARVERINAGADISPKGEKESAAMMVNYLYDPSKIEAYHEQYAGEGKRNAASAVRQLARGWGLTA
jgi:malonyl-CoA decarboxylase